MKLKFDQLDGESETRWRQLSISFYDRFGYACDGPSHTTELLRYLQQHKGVTFKRKDEIARMTLEDKTSLRA